MALSRINSPSMTLSWINSLCVTLSEKCHESLQAMISSMVATLFTDKARALNLSSYIDVCTTVCTLWKTYNVYLNLNLRQLYFLHNNVCTLHIRTLLGKTLAWLSKNYFHSEPSLTTTTLREFASTIGFHHHTRTETAPWQYILKIMLVAQICTKKNIFAHFKSTVSMFSTIQRSFRGKASYQNDSSNTFFIHSVPNQTQLYRFVRSECCWSVGVSDLAYRFTLCTLVPRTYIPNRVHVNKRINSIAIYCLSLWLFCYVLQVVPNLQNTHHTYWV